MRENNVKDGDSMIEQEVNTVEKALNRAARCRKRARLHEQNRAKARARRKAIKLIFAAATNAKEY